MRATETGDKACLFLDSDITLQAVQYEGGSRGYGKQTHDHSYRIESCRRSLVRGMVIHYRLCQSRVVENHTWFNCLAAVLGSSDKIESHL